MQRLDWMEPATTTSGAAPDGALMDTVELLVRDLDGMTDFYLDAMTLDVLDQDGDTATLGHPDVPSLVLRQRNDLPSFDRLGAGLYHTAFLFKDQKRLARTLASMAQHANHLYQGSADHLVSEAFYFSDPEGNGIEIYRDRPRTKWQRTPGGGVKMATLPLDPNAFLQQWYDPDESDVGEATSTIGHVHLQVGDLERAREFYVETLGFDVTTEMPGALFVSAGGYHHHIGMNTWHSNGSGPRAATLGLGDVRITVPTRQDVEALKDRLRFHHLPTEDDGRTLRFKDPWGTVLAVSQSAK